MSSLRLRKNHHVRGRTASSFFKAAVHARDHGRRLNLLVTVNLWQTACSTNETSITVARMCQKFTRWLLHQSQSAMKKDQPGYGASTYETVIEAPDGQHHVHWFVHVPDELRDLFEKTLSKWVQKTCGPIKDDKVINVIEINDMGLSRYCMKGVDPHYARRCWVKPENQGVVFGKRVSISRSLGPKARMKEKGRPSATGSPLRAGSGVYRGHEHAPQP